MYCPHERTPLLLISLNHSRFVATLLLNVFLPKSSLRREKREVVDVHDRFLDFIEVAQGEPLAVSDIFKQDTVPLATLYG